MTGIKKTIMTIAFCTVFVLAAVLFVPKTVFANGDQGEITRGAHYSTSEDHGEIQSDKPVKIDLDSVEINPLLGENFIECISDLCCVSGK